ncbi:MAG TPA: cation:proton antiporter [Xanthobacteraceae bacterium]|nr:cation:proton antiporter [Xanthobacteraceae bacterium]
MLNVDGFKNFLIFLAAAGVIVPLFHRAQIGTVLGFFIVGAALGPYGIGLLIESYPWLWYVTFDDPQQAAPLAELGIIFLLFLLGLSVSMRRLWQLRRYVLGVGLAQVALTAIAVSLLVRWRGAPASTSLVLGLCLAMSSTAVVMQLLIDQRRAATQVGRIALSVLLFQDLMVVPILAVIGILGGETVRGAGVALAFVQALLAVAVIMVAGRYVMRPFLHSAARTGSRELIMAIALLMVVGIAATTQALGLSVGLGAFLAGVLLSESEYRHHIEVDLEPFKGLLLGIFFVTVGTSVDLRVVWTQAPVIVGAVVALVALKAAILFAVARVWRVATGTAVELALLLAQGGEFAFVVIGIARGNQLLSPELASAAVAVVVLSMMITPALAMLARHAGQRVGARGEEPQVPLPDVAATLEDHVVIGGFGRVGQTVARLLERENIPYVALDRNAALVAEQHKAGRSVYFGDASRGELLRRAGAEKAQAFVVTMDEAGAAERMVQTIMQIRPGARVFVRARDAAHAERLAQLGATCVIPETEETSLQLSGRVLQAVGLPGDVVDRKLAEARRVYVTAKPLDQ